MTPTLLISTHAIGKSYGAEPLFSDISLQIFTGEKMGLVGPNGAGKSTLLRILAGWETPDTGRISKTHHLKTSYIPQEDNLDPEKTIEETLFFPLPDGKEAWRVARRRQEIMDLIDVRDTGQFVGNLSGGWLKRVSIGRALFQDPDLLLLDEPTNHLDLESILWLERLLKNAPFAFVLVSHDRYFLENVTNRMGEIDRRYGDGFYGVSGTYSDFIEKREKYFQERKKQEAALSNKVRREIEWLRRGPKARSSKARFRIDQADRMQEDLADLAGRNTERRGVEIDFDATRRKTKVLLEASGLEKSMGGRRLFGGLGFKLTPGAGIGILGRNGTGKSTLIRLLDGRLAPDAGAIRTPEGVRIVTFDQNRRLPDENRSLRRTLSPDGDSVVVQGRSIHVVAWAKRFLFQPEQLGMPVAGLSGGEKARVLIADLMRQPADILLLDEPTNDLDIPTLEVLEESLASFPGAVVLITHDRLLMDRICDRVVVLDGNGAVETFADVDQWMESRANRQVVEAKSPAAAKTAPPPTPGRLAREEQKELNRLEGQIEKAEQAAAELERRLNDPEIMSDAATLSEIYAEHEATKKKIEALYGRWEALESKRGG